MMTESVVGELWSREHASDFASAFVVRINAPRKFNSALDQSTVPGSKSPRLLTDAIHSNIILTKYQKWQTPGYPSRPPTISIIIKHVINRERFSIV